tara:strand:- start:818 stop:1528 length:711 start_codon:yes stop_codon:yes gene_type:complete
VIKGFFQKLFKPETPNHPILDYIHTYFGFRPEKPELYIQAIRHKSQYEGLGNNNERLEFLGDSVLDLIVAESLYYAFPDQSEGYLTKMRAKIVSRKTLNSIAIQTGLESIVEAQLEYDAKHTSIGGNALEAIIGAVYLEKGCVRTGEIIKKHILDVYVDFTDLEQLEFDPKSKLIEYSQKHHLKIEFKTFDHESDSKQKHYASEIYLNDEKKGFGIGTSKKKAEQNAARNAFENIG